MQFLYFLKNAPAQVDLAEWGLSHVGTASSKIASRQVHAQHMGDGLLVTRGDVDLCRVDPTGNNQIWHKMPTKFTGGKEVWCGWWLDKIPTAETLARPQQIEGCNVAMITGEKWVVPILRQYVESDEPGLVYRVNLPQVLDYDTDGNLRFGQVVPQYAGIWKKAIQVSEFLTEGAKQTGEVDFSLVDVIEFAGQLLGLNYYVSIFELIKLELLTQEIANHAIRKALDFDGWSDRLKNLVSRSQSSGTTSQSGGEHSNVETPATTDQPLPI
jgi:hypothetical protein